MSEGALPPHDLDAEAAVLASVLIDPASMPKIDGFLRPEHFYSESHRRIFEGCVAIRAQAQDNRIDIVTVATWLKDRDRISQVGGLPYMGEIITAAPAIANVVAYAETILDKWRARQTIAICQSTAARGYIDYGDAQTYVDQATNALANIGRMGIRSSAESNLEALRRIVKAIASAANGTPADRRKVMGIPTGLDAYDRLTNGLHATHKTTVVALPGIGKTAMALQWLAHAAFQGIGGVLFSTEMKKDEILKRLLSMFASVDGDRLKKASLSGDDWASIRKAMPILEKLPIEIDDTPNLTIDDIRARSLAMVDTMRIKHGVPLGLFAVDYVQRLQPVRSMERAKKHEWIAHSSRGIKLLAQELKIPAIELAQQKATPIDSKTKLRPPPTKGCTADSSDIEKESDEVVYLHREPKKDMGGRVVGEDDRSVRLILAKQRDGCEGRIPLRFLGEFSRFECLKETGT